MARKNALGRGLSALIDDADEVKVSADLIKEIEISRIEANPNQPRTNFSEESLTELASSIKQLGVIQPITLREVRENKYQIIAGERRFRASKMAGLKTIPAFVRHADDNLMLEMALVENIQREDLNSIEIAITYQRLLEECELTHEKLSDRVGKKRSTISNYLRLLKLPAEIQKGLIDKKLSMGHARAIVNIESPEIQLKIYNQILKLDLSVRKVEELVKNLGTNLSKAKSKIALAEEYIDLQNHLSKHFNSKIEFKRNTKGRGKIVIPFKSDDDLERIISIIDK